MNTYKSLFIIYHKFLFLLKCRFISDFPPKYSKHRINLKNNNLNLIIFTLESFNFIDFKTLMSNYFTSNLVSEETFFNNTPNNISIFDSEGWLLGHLVFFIDKPNDRNDVIAFNRFVFCLMLDIIRYCVYETMDRNVSTKKYQFYISISTKNNLDKSIDFFYPH